MWTFGLFIFLISIIFFYKKNWFAKRKKELILFSVSVSISLLFLEVSSRIIGSDFNKLELYDDGIAAQNKLPNWASTYIIHPFVGYVKNPASLGTNKFGFSQTARTDASNEFHLAITGGSVALGFCYDGASRLINILESSIAKDKKIIIDCLAHGGWKQPQQLFALNYLLLNNLTFDLVVNIDGFNELSKSSENVNNNISIIYPDLWNAFASSEYNIEDLETILEIKKARQLIMNIHQILSNRFLGKSGTATLIGNVVNNYSVKKVTELNQQLQKVDSADNTGPVSTRPLDLQLIDILEIWADSSRFIEGLSSQHGFEYFHFIQPNQYHANSKPLSKEELATAYQKGGSPLIREWYPKMIAVGHKLADEGIRFFDATDVFENETRSLYTDTCCHFNKLGNEIFAEYIAERIIDNYFDTGSQ